MKKFLYILFILIGILAIYAVVVQIRNRQQIGKPHADAVVAFPGAQGFGAASVGGRGGRIIEVKNLNSSGTDSLKAAIEADGPRIVVFRVGGVIRLYDMPIIRNPYITIAGQTAPGGGIVLRGAGITVATHDVIIRGLKIRPGDDREGEETRTRDAINISNTTGGNEIYNVIIDHNSLSWALDETASVYNNESDERKNVHNITFSWNIISEALDDSIHVDEGRTWPNFDPHSTGMIIKPSAEKRTPAPYNVTIANNLFAHIKDRNPRVQGKDIEVINNLIYNWATGPTIFSAEFRHFVSANVIGNHYITGTDTRNQEPKRRPIWTDNGGTMTSQSKLFVNDNIGPNNSGGSGNSAWENVFCDNGCHRTNTQAFTSTMTSVKRSSEVKDLVLQYAGATTQQDRIDDAIRNDVRNGSGSVKDCVVYCDENSDKKTTYSWSVYSTSNSAPQDSDHDGMPNTWETSHGSNPNLDDSANVGRSGYTLVEEYLNSLIRMPAYLIPTPTNTSTPTPTPTQTPVSDTTIVKKVFKSSDDVEQLTSNGRMDLNSVDLDMFDTVDGPVVIGLRFGGVNIPQGRTIREAFFEFTAAANNSEATTIEFYGHDTDYSNDFVSTNWNLSSDARPKTDATISWNVPTFSRGVVYRSPNIAQIVQEIVNRSGWKSGNAMAFILRGTGKRVATSFDGNSANAPKLTIIF